MGIPQALKEAPAEFSDAVELDRFHRYAMVRDDQNAVSVNFGLLGKDGINRYFRADLGAINTLAAEFNGLAQFANALAEQVDHSPPDLGFASSMCFILGLQGGESHGHLILRFVTPTGQTISTAVGPLLAAQMHASLKNALDSLPNPPEDHPTLNDGMGLGVEGHEHQQDNAVIHFGQKYDPKILQAFGLLMVRANILERHLVHLLCAVSGMTLKQAQGIFFSTVNARARLDMIKSLLPVSGLNEGQQKSVERSLDKAQRAVKRRNTLVHGHWAFKGEKFEVRQFEPNKAKPVSTEVVTVKSIESLATDYRIAGFEIETEARQIFRERRAARMAAKAAATPSSTEPNN